MSNGPRIKKWWEKWWEYHLVKDDRDRNVFWHMGTTLRKLELNG